MKREHGSIAVRNRASIVIQEIGAAQDKDRAGLARFLAPRRPDDRSGHEKVKGGHGWSRRRAIWPWARWCAGKRSSSREKRAGGLAARYTNWPQCRLGRKRTEGLAKRRSLEPYPRNRHGWRVKVSHWTPHKRAGARYYDQPAAMLPYLAPLAGGIGAKLRARGGVME